MDYFVGAFFIGKANWWKNKTDPWVTNASYLNAFWAWPLWFVACVLMLYACLGVLAILVNCFKRSVRRDIFKFLFKLPMWLWCYLRGLSEYQFEKPFDMLSQTCPVCRKGFTLQDRVTKMNCEYKNHIYHTKCLA